MAMHTFLRRLQRDGKDICGLTITVYSADKTGNYVEKNDVSFSRHEATWYLQGDRRDTDEYQNCVSLEEAYQMAIDSITQHFGPGHSVGS